MATITIPIRLVLSSISESETSGTTLVTPVQSRRKAAHGLPAQHPHRNRRKVSAPPELQAHLGPYTPPQLGGANHGAPNYGQLSTEYVISLPTGQTHLSEGLNSGSDSGVPSEYSSWAAPVSGSARPDTSSPDDDFASPSDSIDDLAEQQPHKEKSFYIADSSDSEQSLNDISSPLSRRKSGGGGGAGGATNEAYEHDEPSPLILSVRSPSSHTLETPIQSMSPMNIAGIPPRGRANSMVLQLNLQGPGGTGGSGGGVAPGGLGAPEGVPPVSHSNRSVSMISLNTAHNHLPNNHTTYPNLANLADSQSIYSEVNQNTGYSMGYLGQRMGSPMGSQASLAGVGYKVIDSQQTLMHHHLPQISPADVGDSGDHDDDEPQSTEVEENKRWFKHTLSENLSLMYAIFLFMLGIVIYMADTFSGHDSAMAEGFNIYLIIVQLLWLAYVHIDVRRYLQTISRSLEEAKSKQKNEQVQVEPTGDGQYQLRINLPESRKPIPQFYGFTSGRHGGSIYLKIGATVFCFGHLIHTGLSLGQKLLYLTADDPTFDDCTCTTDVVMSVLTPIYAFYQLFFIFKYSNLIINRRKLLSRFGLMHCISSSLCFWFYTILQETLQAIFQKKSSHGNYSSSESSAASYSSVSAHATPYGGGEDSDELDDDDHHYTGNKIHAYDWSINYGCEKTTDLSEMINYTTPYLFPFSIEYNILIVGVWILLWENIGRTDRHTHIPSVEVSYEEDNRKSFTSNLIIYVDCHSSNRGLFAGLLMTVATVISIILFFIFTSSAETRDIGLLVNAYSELLLMAVMAVSSVIAFNAVRQLDVVKQSVSSVDDIILFVCLPCIFLYAFLNLFPELTLDKGDKILYIIVSALEVMQVIVQTALICDGLRRCSNSKELQQRKPGRELVTFLVVANVAMWLLETFEIKSQEGNSDKYKYYGPELWTLLSHLTLPLVLFYRFHSSVCLADMWKASYEVDSEH
ncbi:proton channel OtopLc-like isoform X2 [Oratosquilla oratoria]|uniref:proton channel OtopLc-like isoform X2 n=1 Tax=Oratosquilla oratoria TaxID=337810 RepID=UPI003F7593A3